MQPRTLEDPIILRIATAHGKSPAQVLLRWHLQEGRSALPKSTKPHRIAENFDVFDFALSIDELTAIDALDTGKTAGPPFDEAAPEAVALFAMTIPAVEACRRRIGLLEGRLRGNKSIGYHAYKETQRWRPHQQ